MRFVKGHGTENDFVIVPDPEGELDLPADRVAALCDRRAGIGGDGLLRVVRSAADHEARAWPGRPRPSGSWTTATATVRSPRCAATASGCSRATSIAPGMSTEGDLAVATRGGVKAVHIGGERRRHRRHGPGAAARGDVKVSVGDRTWPAAT